MPYSANFPVSRLQREEKTVATEPLSPQSSLGEPLSVEPYSPSLLQSQDRLPSGERAVSGHKRPSKSYIPCNLCDSLDFSSLFKKSSSQGEIFQVVRCNRCALVYVNPQPNEATLLPYYRDSYFLERSDRGYNNYYSAATRRAICAVYKKNLQDLDFDGYELSLLERAWMSADCNQQSPREVRAKLGAKSSVGLAAELNAKSSARYGAKRGEQGRDFVLPRALDIGCAAGYFLDLLQERGWEAEGIELSDSAAHYGRLHLGLKIFTGDFLKSSYLQPDSYDLVTLWASIEHLPDPRLALRRCYQLLRPGGRLFLSTCRYGWLARLQRDRWRFMNLPEHLYFFSKSALKQLAFEEGFDTIKAISYGSGFTRRSQMGWGYRLTKTAADFLVKAFDQGDMLALHLYKRGYVKGGAM